VAILCPYSPGIAFPIHGMLSSSTVAMKPGSSLAWLPRLCEMMQLDGRNEHRDMRSTYQYVLWVLDDGANVVFLHKDLLNRMLYGTRCFIDWLAFKPHDECCRMVSRTLLASLRYKPDYIVLVGNDDVSGAPYASGYSMCTMLKLAEGNPTLEHIRAVAEGYMDLQSMVIVTHPVVAKNLPPVLERRLSELCCVLADRGFFSDPRNRVKYGHQLPRYSEQQQYARDKCCQERWAKGRTITVG
jgi:hypothetical protein